LKPKLEDMGAAIRRLNPHLFVTRSAECGTRNGVGREADLHEQIMDWCRGRGWIFFHGSMAERTHRTEGEPDFVILGDAGRFFLVECKTATGKLSPAQVAMVAHAAKLGHTISVVRSMADFLAAVGRGGAE
jgi:hypothetical protein